MLKSRCHFALLWKYLPTGPHVSIFLSQGIWLLNFNYLVIFLVLYCQDYLYPSRHYFLNWRIDFTFSSSALLNSQYLERFLVLSDETEAHIFTCWLASCIWFLKTLVLAVILNGCIIVNCSMKCSIIIHFSSWINCILFGRSYGDFKLIIIGRL